MGFKERMGEAMEAAKQQRSAQAATDAASQARVAEGNHYDVTVNKNDLNVERMARMLNQRWRSGWRLVIALEQHGNTVCIFERREAGTAPPPAEGPPGPGWWKASDGRWYPPESRS